MIEHNSFKVKDTLPFLDDIISEWFDLNYSELSEPQKKAIPLIHEGKNVLVSSPTGTGKTLTGFLSIINELFKKAKNNKLEDRIYCVYISPLKALANDINKNLREPLSEIYAIAREKNIEIPEIRVGVRSGDTAQSERNKMLKKPPHILITTPESLSLALTATKFREKFSGVEYVILDEIHEISSTKRGSLLSLNLERLSNLAGEFVRIGLSATQAPLDLIGSYLCGYKNEIKRDFELIEVNTNKYLDLKIITPVKDLTMVSYEVANEKMYDILVDLINSHKTTLIFTNTRSSTEHVAIRLKARGIENIEAHHSSLGKETRIDVENKLKNGELKCVITSTSLELGIDIGYIDLVIQIGSPKSVSRALQRIGRSGHGVKDLSLGRFIVFDLDDLMECTVMTKAAYDHEIDRVSVPLNPLDVLSQGLIGMSLEQVWNIDEAYNLIRGSFSFHTLEYSDYISTLKYLAGEIEGNTLFSKIWLDEEAKTFGKKRSTRMIYFMNVGTIPEEANYNVVNEHGRIIGQLSDKFVERLKKGDIFVLGAKTYIFVRTLRNNITVKEARGLKPTVPSWSGELLPRSYDLGILIGEFRKELSRKISEKEDAEKWLVDNYRVDHAGAISLISYVKSQGKFDIPTEDHLYVEGYMDGDLYNVIFHIPLGRRVNDALSRAYGLAISNKYDVNTRISVNDNGFMITLSRKIRIESILGLLTSKNFSDLLNRSILNTEMFKQRFRYCATRSLMVLRKYKQTDISVSRQQLRSDKLLRVLESIKNFPVIMETFNEIKNDLMDVDHAKKYLEDVIENGQYKISDYSNESSPFSYNLILSGVSDIVLMEDRSKLLRELQNKLLDKIYGTNGIDFIVKDSKMCENYFKNKIPEVRNMDDYVNFIDHFFYIDPFKRKYNSPMNYTDTDIEDITENLIKNDTLIHSFIRSDQWINIKYYSIAMNLFKKNIEKTDIDNEISDIINETTFNELKKTGYSDEEIRNALLHLESSYSIRKKIKNGNAVYIKNNIIAEPCNDCKELAIKLILSSYGPLSLDELLIKLPIDSSILENTLNSMVMKNDVVFDYITPIFVKQYIMKDDLNNILNITEENLQEKRVDNFISGVSDVKEYFEKYGFAFDIYDIIIRTKNFATSDLEKMIKNKKVYHLKIIKNKYVYASDWLVNALYYLRDEKSSENEQKVLDFIGRGYDTEEKLTGITGYDSSIIRLIIRELVFKIKIINNNGVYERYTPAEKIDGKILIEKYGPVTSYELSRFFWFNPSRIDYTGIKPYYYKNDVYYGGNEHSQKNNGLILSSFDPVNIYMGKYIRNDEFNSRFIYNGKEEATFQMINKPPGLWIDNIFAENESIINEFISRIEKVSDKLKLDSIIINSDSEDIIKIAEKRNYKISENVAYKGNFEIMNINDDDLLEITVKLSSLYDTPLNYNILNKTYFGIRNEIESSYFGIRSIELNNYYNSILLYNFNGPFSVGAFATKNVISVYKSIRKRELTQDEETVLKSLISENMTENELIKTIKMNSFVIKNTIKSLYKINAIARDKNRKYIVIGDNYSELEAIDILLKYMIETMGFFDDEIYSKLTDTPINDSYIKTVRDMIGKNIIKEVLLPSERKIVYISSKVNIDRIRKMKFTRIISPKDIVFLFFSDFLKARYRSSSSFYLFVDNSIKTYFTVKKSGKFFSVRNIEGDKTYRDVAKREFGDAGYILSL